MNFLHNSNENVLHPKHIGSLEINHFDKVAEPLEEIARVNPSLMPLLKLVRKGYEEACHKMIAEERHSYVNDTVYKLKQEITMLKRDRNQLIKQQEAMEHDIDRYKSDIMDMQADLKKLKTENKTLASQSKKFNDMERKYSKIENENKELKRILEELRKKDFDILQKLDLDEYNLTSDDLRSEHNKKFKKGVECKGHPLVPKLDFKKIYEWRDQQQLDEIQDDDQEEEEEEEELLTENEKYLFKGSELQSNASMIRKDELERRKEEVIAILNKTYADDENEVSKDITDELDSFKDNEVLFHDVAPEYEHSVNLLKYKSHDIDDRSLSA